MWHFLLPHTFTLQTAFAMQHIIKHLEFAQEKRNNPKTLQPQ